MWVAIPLDIVSALLVMKLAAFGPMKEGVAKQFEIFRNKHTWSMTALYIVTFGSFIGFSMALPLSMKVIFGVSHVPDANGVMQHTLNNPNAPTVLAYAWIGPFVGAAVRPVGGWISDKVGGSIVTQIISAVMVVASVAVGYVMMQAYGSATPEQYFPVFLGLFVVLFFASGIGNGSTFRTIGVIFDRTAGRPGAGLDLGDRRLRRLHRADRDRRPDQGRHAAVRDVRLRGVLRAVPGPQLVVLPAPQRVREEPVITVSACNTAAAETHDEPFSRSPHLFLAARGKPSPTATASPPAKTAPGRTPTATAGRTTRSCARRTA